jgi:hypothetical protein
MRRLTNQNFPGPFGQGGFLGQIFDMMQPQQQGGGQFGLPGFPQGPGGRPPFLPPGQGGGPGGQPPFLPPGQGGGPGGRPPFLPPGQGDVSDGQFGGGGPSVLAVDPGSFYGCLRRLTLVRLTNGRSFWFFPTFIGRQSVAGFRWFPANQRWRYTGFDTQSVRSFQCF